MPRLYKLICNPLVEKIFLCVLAGVYLVYLVGFAQVWFPLGNVGAPTVAVVEDQINTNPASVLQYWNTVNMNSATDEDAANANQADSQRFAQTITAVIRNGATTKTLANTTSTGVTLRQMLVTADGQDVQISNVTISNQGKAVQQEGQAPSDGNLSFPLSTVGKIFFSDSAGRNYVCSGTAVVSNNHSVVDTAGHCLYGQGQWMRNEMFCPLYNKGIGPYGCWVARALFAPAEWINARQNELHRDFGMIVVDPNEQGNLTDVVGGSGWADNQSTKQAYYAYGYPAASPFDGQTRQSCDQGSVAKSWQHAGGFVISIPCNMTGGSSGGPWFIKSGNSWYLDGHNDFTSTIQRGHMFSPYYDDTWFAMYSEAQNA